MKLIKGLHLTQTEKSHIAHLIKNNVTKCVVNKIKHYEIRKISENRIGIFTDFGGDGIIAPDFKEAM